MNNGIGRLVTVWSVLGGVVLLAILFGLFGLILRAAVPGSTAQPEATPLLVVIPAPTPTLPGLPTMPPTVAPTPSGELSTPSPNEAIKIGDYVQISGTGGDGLRIRAEAGTQNPVLFLGMDAEVFEVIGGPKESNNLIWWNLKAPYDGARSGWAASNYLSLIAKRP